MIRTIEKNDLPQIRGLVKKCEPLGFHTLYTYWVLNYHFNDLFLISENNSQINGMINGLVSIRKRNTAFIWQLGVDPEFRGLGLSLQLIDEFCNKALKLGVKTILVTIDPQNKASLNVFKKYAESLNRELQMIDSLNVDDLYSVSSENETVYSFEIY